MAAVSKPKQSKSPSPPNKSLTPRTSKQDYVYRLWTHLFQRIKDVADNKDIKFEELTKVLNDKTLILITAKFWSVLQSFCNQTKLDSKKNDSESIKKGRIILSSLIISKFPTDVLDVSEIEKLDGLGENCYTSAKKVVESILSKHPINFKNASKLHCDEVVNSVNHFFSAFLAWQNSDISKVLTLVVSNYGQWRRSHKVMEKSSMNEAQKKGVLSTLAQNMMNTRKRIQHLVGMEKGNEICDEIDKIVANEPEHHLVSNANANTNTNTNVNRNDMNGKQEADDDDEEEETKQDSNNDKNNNDDDDDEEDNERLSVEEQLRRRGVPSNIRSGRNLVKELPNKKSDEHETKEDESSKYIQTLENGQKVMNLDTIVMEEASKKYWLDFAKEIESENFSRLFELLTEILTRLKKISPQKQHKSLDDLIDVAFIKQTIENGLIDAKGFYGIFYGIWEQIKSLHAPSEDKAWQKWHETIVAEMSASDATWAKLLPEVFNRFLMKLDKIEAVVKVFKEIKEEKRKKKADEEKGN